MCVGDPNHVARRQIPISLNLPLTDECAVATVQVPQHPLVFTDEELRMMPALSSRVSESAAQLRQTKGPFFRGLAKCIARATSSLPTPLSPRIRMVARHSPKRASFVTK